MKEGTWLPFIPSTSSTEIVTSGVSRFQPVFQAKDVMALAFLSIKVIALKGRKKWSHIQGIYLTFSLTVPTNV